MRRADRHVGYVVLGFQLAADGCEQPPALKAICAIYATDDRWTDDVHWRGGALRLVDLVDYYHYMTPMTCCRRSRRSGATGGGGVVAAAGDQRAVGADVAAGVAAWAYWDHGSVRLGGTTSGYERDRVPDDGRGGLGRRLPQQLLPDRARWRRSGRHTGCSPGLGPRRRGHRDAGAADHSTPSWRDGSTTGCAAPGRTWTPVTSSSARPPGPSPTSTCTRAAGPPAFGPADFAAFLWLASPR